ncbi:MAG: serine/threonine-protein kinase [Candidatus Thiodiazotropha sp.]
MTDLKERFQGFVDGQNTFEELKHAVCHETMECDDTVVRDFVASAHRNGLLSDTHFRALIDEISNITGQKYYHGLSRAANGRAASQPPKQLTVLNNRFVLGPIIGKGGMGLVYKARDLRKMEANDSNDVVAIKVLSSNLRAHPESLIALQREATKAQKLAHPNIVTVYDFDRDGDIAYMTMEFLDGIPLSKIIEAHAPLPRTKAIRIINSIARALSYAHKQQIVHSDLKPSNIFVLRDGNIKILDFGISRALLTNDDTTRTPSLLDTQSFTAFTPAYASCEMINNEPPTPKDDIFALGCVAHELLTRKHPYNRRAADKVKADNVEFQRHTILSSQEYRAIRHAVDLDKSKRTETVSDFLREITEKKSESSFFTAKAAGIVLIALVIAGGTYTTNKIKNYEKITQQQAIIVKNLDIENTLKKADKLLKNKNSIASTDTEALSLYSHVLTLDKDNSIAKSGISKLRSMYLEAAQSSIKEDDLVQANTIVNILESSFDDFAELHQVKDELNHHLTENQIKQLLRKAYAEELDNSYVRPKDHNAYDTFLEVLKLSPNDYRALEGISRVRTEILAEAETLIENDEWTRADSRIKDALLISPGNADALALYNKIKIKKLSDEFAKIQGSASVDSPDAVSSKSIGSPNGFNTKLAAERLNLSQSKLIDSHIQQAQYYTSKNILIGTGTDNASFHYRKILDIDNTNEYARTGLNTAWNFLTKNVNIAAEGNRFDNAISLLAASKSTFSPIYNVDRIIHELSSKRDELRSEEEQHDAMSLLLSNAKSQIKQNRWTLPKGDNAVETYLEILDLDPSNEEAKIGLKQAEYIFASRINLKISNNDYSGAESILARALILFPNSKLLLNLQPTINKSQKEYKRDLEETELANKIQNLLKDAQAALKSKHYILPIENCAFDLFSQVNSLDPGNTSAIRGMNQAKFRTYDQIENDIRLKNFRIANLRMSRLSQLGVDDKHYSSLHLKLTDLNQSNNHFISDLIISENYLLDLLMFASQQETLGSTWPPAPNNAYNIYKEVLAMEPLNDTAKTSLKKIFRQRLNHIGELLDNKKWDKAESELKQLSNLYNQKTENAVISSTIRKLNDLRKDDKESRMSNFGTL